MCLWEVVVDCLYLTCAWGLFPSFLHLLKCFYLNSWFFSLLLFLFSSLSHYSRWSEWTAVCVLSCCLGSTHYKWPENKTEQQHEKLPSFFLFPPSKYIFLSNHTLLLQLSFATPSIKYYFFSFTDTQSLIMFKISNTGILYSIHMCTIWVYTFTSLCLNLEQQFFYRRKNVELMFYVKQTGSVSLKGTPPLTIIIYKRKYPEYDTSQFSLI